MTDLTTLRATRESSFADAVVWEIVMQHEMITVGALQRIDDR